MNKNQFRIIFNRARGMLMVVAEYAKSHGSAKGPANNMTSPPAQASQHTATIRPLAFSLMLALGMVGMIPNSLSVNTALADIVADQAAPANQRPMITNAANGVPLVNIQTPSAAGVSRNTYSQFDVNNQGVILNNSRNNVQTQLGGFVQGNPYMAAGSARIILNEVNSQNPSLLNGYVEVAGSRAQVVIANPAGISCNGCGFINANRATLTTGTPIFNAGDLIGYRVTGGSINFLGTGLDSTQSNYTDIIARAVNVNAGLFANDLNIVTGTNQVNVASAGDITGISPIAGSGSAPGFALDVAALGGMYAGKIRMIGTEAGLGVRNAGQVDASVGEVSIDVNGVLTNTATGRMISQQAIQLQASHGLDNAGVIYASGNSTLSTQGNLTNTGTIANSGNLNIIANGANSSINSSATSVLAAGLNADGTLQSLANAIANNTGNLTVGATQSIAALGQNLAAKDQDFSAQALNLSGSQAIGRNVHLTASNGNINATNANITANGTLSASATKALITDGASVSTSQLDLAANGLSNVGGELIQTGVGNTAINLAGNLNNNQGRIATNSSNFALNAQTLTNTDGSIEHAGSGTLSIHATTLNGTRGSIASNSNLNLTAQAATLDAGSTVAAQIYIDAATLSNRGGEIIQRGTGASTINASSLFDNTAGTFASNGNTLLAVGNLVNRAGNIQVGTDSNLLIQATGLIDNSGAGNINAGGLVNMTAAQLLNATGKITATQNLAANLTQALDNRQGLIAANQGVIIATTTIDNSQGTIASVQAGLTANATSGAINNNGGRLQSAQDISLSSVGLNNTDGVVTAANAYLNSQSATFNNTGGSIAAQGTLQLQSGQLVNDAGLIQAAGTMSINTQGQALINKNSGTTAGIIGQSTVLLNTGNLINQSGFIGAKDDLTANSAAISNTQSGMMTSEADISLSGTSLDNRGGQVQALGNVTVNAGSGNVDNTASLLRAGQTLTVTAGSVINTNTLAANQGLAGQNVSIAANQINNALGAIRADDELILTGHGIINNTQGLISSGNTLTLADSNLAAKVLTVSNSSGTLLANTNISINSAGLTGDGQILSRGNLTANLSSDYTQTSTGQLQANGNLSLATTGNITNQSSLLAGQTLTLNAANIDNTATGEISGLNTYINASNTLTNRGVIDGSDTFITAANLNNIGTGSIFGDHLAIAANTLNNNSEIVNSITNAAVIAARYNLDIGAQNITNQNNSLLFSGRDMAIGGGLNANHQATVAIGQPQVATLTNRNATIEALENLNANVADLQNLNAGITTQTVVVDSRLIQEVQPEGWSQRYDVSRFPTIFNYNIEGQYFIGDDGVARPAFEDYSFFEYTETTLNTSVVSSKYAQLLSGGNMTLNGNITNSDSKIIAGGALNVTGGTINNLNTSGQIEKRYNGYVQFRDWDGNDEELEFGRQNPFNPASSFTTFNLPTSTVVQGTAPVSTGTQVTHLTPTSVTQTALGAGSASVQISPIATVPVITTVAVANTVNGQSVNSVVATVSPNIAFPTNSLFQVNRNPSSGYLIETNPRFANYRSWLSSDYMLNQLNYDPATMTKRLGDGFYEQKLIREQVSQLTGQRFLAGYSNEEAQYQALMVNGITFAKAFNITPGIALTELQMAQLTSDIVWLVEQTITLPDGSTTRALVPQVYARLRDGDLSNTGSLLAGNSINLNLTGDVTNAGTFGSRTLLALNADNLHNLGGLISARDVQLNARQDLNNIGGSITAQSSLLLSAGHDINVTSTTQSSQNAIGASSFSRTNLDRVAGLYVTGGEGLMQVVAGNDIQLNAVQLINTVPTSTGDIASSGQTILKAGNNISLGTVQIAEQNNSIETSKRFNKSGGTQDIGTSIQTTGDITLTAGNNLSTKAADISSSDGALVAIAGNDITIATGDATANSSIGQHKKKSGTLSSKTSTRVDTFNSESTIASNLSADSITLVAGAQTAKDGTISTQQGQGNLNIQGSTIVATNDVNLSAGKDINIVAATETSSESHYNKVKKSGFSTSGASVTYGSSKLTTTNDTQTTTNVASTIGSVEGDVNIKAGQVYTQTASDILTPAGDIDISAQQVNIQAGQDTYANQQTMKYQQAGITLAVSSPVISAIQTAEQMSKAASKTDDPRMQALAAATTALAANNAKDAIIAGNTPKLDENGLEILDANGNNSAQDPANQAGGINVSISIGSSKSKSSTTQTSSTAASSHLTAGGDIHITATGAGNASDINIIGSQVKANNDVTLKAEDQINLQAAQNVDTLKSKNSSSSASVGISFGTDGLLLTVGASGSKGKAKGNGSTWTETQIQGGNQTGDKVTLESGTDTTLKGAQVIGNQVIANIGTSGSGNLNIESLQDSNQYKAKQQSIGGSVSIGYGRMGGSFNYSDSKTDSNYQSVNEQSGIMAGDGGFQVNVNGNTNLTGAVISSTDKAIQQNLNNLTTQTLTTSNIENSAEYEAEGVSVGTGVGLNKQSDGSYKNAPTASAGSSSQSDDSTSLTVSGISGGTINITANHAQLTKTGQDATTTIATLNRDVQTQLTTDANGNTTAIAVDSQGNNLASTLTPIFDQEKVERELNAQVQITQAFSQVAPKAVADYATSQLKDLMRQAQEADIAGDKVKATQLLKEAEKWDDGGLYRVALHTLVGGLSGNLEGALGAGTSAATIPKLGELLKDAGMPATLKQALIMATATAIGNAVGGTAGAGAALSEATNNYLTHNDVETLNKKLKTCKSNECINNLLRDAIMLSESRDGKDLTSRILYEAAHAGTIDLITLTLLDSDQSFMVRQAASSLLNINMDDEGIGQQNYSRILAAQLALAPPNGATIGVISSNVVSPEKYAQNGQNAIMSGYVIGTLSGAMVMATPNISLGNAIVASTATNTGLNAYSQFDKYGEIKYPAELAINAGFGVLEGVLGRYSGTGFRGVANEAVIGGSSNVITTLTVNRYYQYDEDHNGGLVLPAIQGAIFGAGVKGLEERKIVLKPVEPYLDTWLRNLIWK